MVRKVGDQESVIPVTAIGFGNPEDDVSYVDADTPLPIVPRRDQQLVANCVIANGQSLSAAVDLGVFRLSGIVIPAAFEPTQITFQASVDGVVWNNLYSGDGTEKSLTVAPNRRVIVIPAEFFGIRFLKVRGGTSGAATNVAAQRTLQLIAEA